MIVTPSILTEVTRSKTAGTSSTVDGISEPSMIAELFASKYQSLYNSVSYSTSDIDKIKQCVQSRIANTSTMDALSANISAVEVGMCVAMYKCHKDDGGTGLNTNHFKYASTDLQLPRGTFAVCRPVSWQCS